MAQDNQAAEGALPGDGRATSAVDAWSENMSQAAKLRGWSSDPLTVHELRQLRYLISKAHLVEQVIDREEMWIRVRQLRAKWIKEAGMWATGATAAYGFLHATGLIDFIRAAFFE